MRRALVAALAAVAVLLPAPARANQLADTVKLVQMLNISRAGADVGFVTLDIGASRIAQGWAEHMAAQGGISHNPNVGSALSTVARWTRWGENVAAGTTLEQINGVLWNSPGHRANSL